MCIPMALDPTMLLLQCTTQVLQRLTMLQLQSTTLHQLHTHTRPIPQQLIVTPTMRTDPMCLLVPTTHIVTTAPSTTCSTRLTP